MAFNEIKQHGTVDFPFELYKIDSTHPKYEMVLHFHPNIEIIRVIEGKLNLTLDNKKFVANSGEVYFVGSNSLHGAIPDNAVYECLVLNLSFLKNGNKICDSFIDDILSRHISVFEKIDNRAALNVISQLFYSIDNNINHFNVISKVYELIGIIKNDNLYTKNILTKTPEIKSVKIKKIVDFVQKNYDKELTLQDIADSCGYSVKYFCQYFKNATGKTPFSYLTDYRIERASYMILSTDMPITQIAYSCGFNDLSYFIKTFKSLKGITPNAYRKSILN